MVRIKYRQHISVIGKSQAQRCSKFNVDNLKNGITAQECKNEVEDLLETLPYAENQNVETAWENTKQVICKAAENTLGYNVKKVRNGWYDEERKEVFEIQNCVYLNMLQRKIQGNIQTYKDVLKEARKIHEEEEEELEELQEKYKRNDVEKFYEGI
jgi:hypothetical protein